MKSNTVTRMTQLTQKRIDGNITQDEFYELLDWYDEVVARDKELAERKEIKLIKKTERKHSEEAKLKMSQNRTGKSRKKDELLPQ